MIAHSELHTIPMLFCPFPKAQHPEADRFTEAGMEFMTKHGLCANPDDAIEVANIDSGNHVACWFPNPNLPAERIQVTADFLWSALRFDDLLIETIGDRGTAIERAPLVAMMLKYIQVWNTPQAYATQNLEPFLQVAHELTGRVRQLATPTQAARVSSGLGTWICTALRLGTLRSLGAQVTFEEFVLLRMNDSGAQLMSDIMGFVCPDEVPGHEWDSETVRATNSAASLVMVCDNDLFSHAKEQRLAAHAGTAHTSGGNLVTEMSRRHGSPPTEAVERVADLRNLTMCLYVQLSRRLRRNASPALAAYLNVVDDALAGNLHFHATGRRYHNPDGHHPHAINFAFDVSETCPLDHHAPPPSSIAWWWDHLDDSDQSAHAWQRCPS